MTTPSLADLARRAADGEALPLAEATALCEGDVLDLAAFADAHRREVAGDDILLVRVRALDWAADPAAPWGPEHPVTTDAPPETPDEIRLTGPAPATAPAVRAALDRVAAAHPGVAIRGLRPAEAAGLAGDAAPATLLADLRTAGLAALALPEPGDAADATRRGLDAAATAGLAVDLPVPYDRETSPAELAATLLDLRGRPGARVVPLPATGPDESPLEGTTGLQDLRVFAASRLLLPGIAHVAVEVDRVGPKLGAIALSAGADQLAGALAQPTARLRAADGEKPRPFNAARARLLIAETGRPAVVPAGADA